MRSLQRTLIIGGAILGIVAGASGTGAQQPAAAPPPTPELPAGAFSTQRFQGVWDYNSRESVNAATGRPEQGPQSATQRQPTGPGSRVTGSGGRGGSPMGGGAMGSGMPPGQAGPGAGNGSFGRQGISSLLMAETRALMRDLLEIPEQLTIKVTDAAVTFVDDLERERTYPTDGSKQKYQLGAAKFDARTAWDGPQLKKQIEGANGFKMVETFFLSSDGNRLFVIVRVGDQSKGPTRVGVNRVYDRVQGQ